MVESRRRFLGWLTGVIAAVIAVLAGVPLLGLLAAPALKRREELWVDLGPAASVPEDQPTEFTFSYWRRDGWFETLIQGTAYAVRPPGKDLFVLSNICTHLGCPVRWSGDVRRFLCPCHRALFDTQGNVVSGPPPRPLDRYAHRIVEGIIQIQVTKG